MSLLLALQVPATVQLSGTARSTERLLAATLICVVALSGTVREVERLSGAVVSKVSLQGTARAVEVLSGQISIVLPAPPLPIGGGGGRSYYTMHVQANREHAKPISAHAQRESVILAEDEIMLQMIIAAVTRKLL